MPTLYIIDAYAQIFRAYYAIRGGMRSPVTGEPTHAVFGFAGMLLKLFSHYRPDYVIVAADSPGKTFRDEMYAEYKQTRSATPDDLTAQIPRVFELVETLGIPTLFKPGLEADDIIATIVGRTLGDPALADIQVRIVSKDKDLEQLLCERVSLFDIHTDTTIDVAALFENKGVRPDQVVDLLALTGDTVDNVPGVDGIGAKTAAQLIQQFGSIEGIYGGIDQIKGKRRENLESARAHLSLSRELVALRRDDDFTYSIEAARVQPPHLPPLIALFKQLGFNRYQAEARALWRNGAADDVPGGDDRRVDEGNVTAVGAGIAAALPNGAGVAPAAPGGAAEGLTGSEQAVAALLSASGVYAAVTTRQQLAELADTLHAQPIFAIDTETTGLERDAALCGMSFSWQAGQGVYVPVRSIAPELHATADEVFAALGPVLADPAVHKCGHNVKFDALALLRSGIRMRGVTFDTMLASALVDPGQASHKLDTLAKDMLGYSMVPITDLIGTGPDQRSMDTVPLDKMVAYAAEDADAALRLYQYFLPRIMEMGMEALVREVEAPLAIVLAEMEHNGILCDPDELIRQGEALQARVEELRCEIFTAAGMEFDLNSPRQLADVLFTKLGLKPGKRTKTGYSTDVEVLDKLALDEDSSKTATWVPRLILEYRQIAKLISTYLGNLRASINARDGRIHTTFHQLVAATGRLASQGPNLQNIPIRKETGRQIRKAFHAPAGHCLICADYSQIELRFLAHFSMDPALVHAFEQDEDIHTTVASQVFGMPAAEVTREQRSRAKTINFGIIYGVTPYGLARRIEGLDVAAAGRLIADYRERFPGIDRFLDQCIQQALDLGYVTTIMGRRRAIPELQSSSATTRSLGERLAINSVIQGSAADLIKLAMVRVQTRIDRDSLPIRMLLQIHDELVLEAPDDAAAEMASIVKLEMEQSMELRVPLRADAGLGKDWMSCK